MMKLGSFDIRKRSLLTRFQPLFGKLTSKLSYKRPSKCFFIHSVETLYIYDVCARSTSAMSTQKDYHRDEIQVRIIMTPEIVTNSPCRISSMLLGYYTQTYKNTADPHIK